MSNLFRFRLAAGVTFVCLTSLVWLTLYSRNSNHGSEFLRLIQHLVVNDYFPENHQVINMSTRNPAMFNYTLNGDGVTLRHVQIKPQRTSLSPHTRDASKKLSFCSCKTGNGWDFKCTVQCPDPVDIFKTDLRSKLRITCDAHVSTEVSANASVPMFNFTDKCLRDELDNQCLDGKTVPNIVHYIFFGLYKLSFFHFLSIWSIHIIQKPCAILIHVDKQLSGRFWGYIIRVIPNIVEVRRAPPSHIFGIPIHLVEHKADVARLEAVRDFGGIYMDTDEILLRSLEPLRKYAFTLSHAYDFNLSNGLIMSSKNASFVNLWYKEYKTYNGNLWGHHSTIVPYKLSQKYPHLIHVENKTFVNPDFDHVDMIFKENFNWSNNYAIHLFIRKYSLEHNFTDIRHLNTTLGAVSRHVLYGCKELCSD
ncbi:uncharacterized protein LOC117336135 isoform X2 [Pecten maximus]|uniref:uncharacterized protein LOC117336135 isoform X2 n=1 Tax=Pecten maximus TaxID=6579 RepID=UPI001459060C|nr:uncharacterized protein LOC117336135 isoform X2 [Pecten maximus]